MVVIYSKILDRIISVIEVLLMILLAVAIVIVSTQIVFRYIFKSPLSWSEQGARCIFIWLTMLSVPCIFRRKGMIAFDLIVTHLKGKARIIFEILVQCIILFFAGYYFTVSVQQCIATGSRVMAGVEIPQNLIYISQPISMFLLVLVMIEQFADSVRRFGKEGKA